MKFGLFYEMPVPTEKRELGVYSEKDMYDALVRQVVAAEEMGFHIVWLPEHHYNLDYSHISAPDVVLMKLAAETTSIHLGPAVAVLPISHPVNVAERYATLDLLSDGRLELGVGRGAYMPWLELFAPGKFKNMNDTRPVFFEAVEIIRRAWTQEWFTHEGQHFHIKEPINVIPKPLQKPHPKVHAPCSSPDSFELYPRLGINAQTQTWVKPLSAIEDEVRRFRKAWAEGLNNPNTLATSPQGEFSCLINAYCAPTRQQAIEELRPYWKWFMARLNEFYTADRVRRQDNRQPYEGISFDKMTFELALEHRMVCVGTPDDCAEYIATLDRFGVDTTFIQFQVGPLPFDKGMKSLRLFGKEVAPRFKNGKVRAR